MRFVAWEGIKGKQQLHQQRAKNRTQGTNKQRSNEYKKKKIFNTEKKYIFFTIMLVVAVVLFVGERL